MQTDTMFRDRWHLMYVKGDTVYRHDSIIQYQKVTLCDTVYQSINDTVTIQVPVVAKLNGWQRFIQAMGYAALGVLIGIIGWFIVKLVIKFI